jgi:hypothetical protein
MWSKLCLGVCWSPYQTIKCPIWRSRFLAAFWTDHRDWLVWKFLSGLCMLCIGVGFLVCIFPEVGIGKRSCLLWTSWHENHTLTLYISCLQEAEASVPTACQLCWGGKCLGSYSSRSGLLCFSTMSRCWYCKYLWAQHLSRNIWSRAWQDALVGPLFPPCLLMTSEDIPSAPDFLKESMSMALESFSIDAFCLCVACSRLSNFLRWFLVKLSLVRNLVNSRLVNYGFLRVQIWVLFYPSF